MRRPVWIGFVAAVVVLISLVGCSGDDASGDGNSETAANPGEAVEGSFVGMVSGTKAFVAIVAAPAGANQQERGVVVYVTDGRRVSESFSGSIENNSFVAESENGDSEAKGNLSDESVTGTVELANGETVRYEAGRPAGASGLYDLRVSAGGQIRGASAGGIGVKGKVELLEGSGVLRLADGRRLRFDVSEDPGDLEAQVGQILLIVLASGDVRGAGMSPAEDTSAFFVRSAS